ncbi:MAG: BrnT family toxin [Defluviitaleaceae bacterium]|nr:BrnT family toxin [Defluviitaleaceae bacterium]
MPTETHEIRGHKFEWDRGKNLSNIEKHGIAFKMAATSFFDPHAETYEDEEHSQDEERFIIIGISESERLLTVCHCYRGKDDSVTRIISARKATRHEEKLYGGAF